MNEHEISENDLAAILLERENSTRIIVGIAGPPGVGKSTFCDRLDDILNKVQPGISAVFPMDGYHFDDVFLKEKGWHAHKGAPHTFDVGGFIHTLGRLKTNDENFVAVPVFDRALEISRAGARLIPKDVKILLVEGNYLLLDKPPWKAAIEKFDISIILKADVNEIERRLSARWAGLNLSPREITHRLEENDLPNVRTVMQQSVAADYAVWTDKN